MYEECTTTNCSCRENEREGKETCLNSTKIRIKVDENFLTHFTEVRQNAITVITTCS